MRRHALAIHLLGVWLVAGIGSLQGEQPRKEDKPWITLKGSWRGYSLCLAFSRDGKTLASGRNDNKVQLWDVATSKELFTMKGHEGPVLAVAFAPDGKTL